LPGATLASVPDHPTKITFHTLRHTHASMLIQEGAPIPLVSRRLGHASTRMTLDTYAHMYPSEEAALAAQLDSARQAAQAPAGPGPGARPRGPGGPPDHAGD
jgi:integrase